MSEREPRPFERFGGVFERFSVSARQVSVPILFVVAFLGHFAAKGNQDAARAQDIVKKFMRGEMHGCITTVQEYPRWDHPKGVYYFPGGPTYFSEKPQPPSFVFVTGQKLDLEKGEVPFSWPVTEDMLKDAISDDGMLCAPTREVTEPAPNMDNLPPIKRPPPRPKSVPLKPKQ